MEKRIKGENGLHYTLFGSLHLEYIKSYKTAFYTGMLLACTLNGYLADLDKQAKALFDRIVSQMAETQGVNEKLKAAHQMEWVGRMNNIRHAAEEIVLHELIYV